MPPPKKKKKAAHCVCPVFVVFVCLMLVVTVVDDTLADVGFRLPQAQEMFAEAQKNVRSGDTIDYRQLGLALRLTRQQVNCSVPSLTVVTGCTFTLTVPHL